MSIRSSLPTARFVSGILALCAVSATGAEDCNNNGIDDELDLLPVQILNDSSFPTVGTPLHLVSKAMTTEGIEVPLDLDGDGNADLLILNDMVSGSYGDESMTAHLGDGAGGFDAGTVFGAFNYGQIRFIVAGDLDEDGDQDLLLLSMDPDDYEAPGTVYVLANDGEGIFQERSAYVRPAGWQMYMASLADFDGDGDLDAAVASDGIPHPENEDDHLEILLNDGLGTMVAGEAYVMGGFGEHIEVGDLDGDGDIDVAVDEAAALVFHVRLFYNNGDGTFSNDVSLIPPNYAYIHGFSITDVDTDGDADVVVAAYPGLQVFRNDGAGTFSQPELQGNFGVNFGKLDSGDIDGDGSPDLFILERSAWDGPVFLLMNDGTGSFGSPEVVLAVGGGSFRVTLALIDVDGDLDLDGIALDIPGSSFGLVRNDELPPYSQDCNSNTIPDECDISDATSLDCNRNDVPDECEEDCNGNGVPDACDLAEVIEYDPFLLLPVSDDPFEIEATSFDPDGTERPLDLNGDGDLDLIVGSENGFLGVLLNRGSSGGSWLGYDPRDDYDAAGGGPTGLAAGDLDGDGAIDIAASSVLGSDLDVLFNDGDGAFPTKKRVIDGNNLPDVAMADFNGDGLLDLVASAENDKKAWVVLNLGNRNFSAPVGFDVGDAPRGIAVADVDGDGNFDIVTADSAEINAQQTPSVTILLGDGTGDFPQSETLLGGVGESPFHLALADLDGDELPELIVADQYGSQVIVSRNLGGAQFVESARFSTLGSPHHVRAADLDDDGDVDLAIADRGTSDYAMILRNDGQGTLDPPHFDPVGSLTSALAAGDCDDDGDMDVFSADQTDNTVTILLNVGIIPASSNDANGDGIPDECLCQADLTGDGRIDGADLTVVLGNWGSCDSGSDCPADLTGDGQVDGADLTVILGNWGECS